MDARTFDSLTRKFAARRSRRRTIATAGLGITAALMGRHAPQSLAQNATPVADGATTMLFVQTFSTATIEMNAADPATFAISLMDGTGQTIYFSDRPERVVGTITDEQLVDGRAFDPADPPNAAIVTVTDTGSETVRIVELTDPTYETDTGTVTYTARELEGQPESDVLASLATKRMDSSLDDSYGPVTLFIDQLACSPVGAHCASASDCCSGFCCFDPLDCGVGAPMCE